MKNFLSRIYSLSIALFLLLTSNASSAQVLSTEDFEGATYPPAGWTMNTAVGGLGNFTTAIWVHRNTGSFPASATAHSGTWMSRYSGHFCADPSTQALITPVIDYSGLTTNDTASVSLWVYRDNTSTAGDSLTVFVNTIADVIGATRLGAIAQSITVNLPDTAASIGWYQYTFQIPQSYNTATNYILFNGTGHIGNNIFTDDVQWTSYPPQCTGTPTIGTVGANPLLICGGSGTTTFTLTGQTTGASGISIVWQSSSTSTGPWNDVANDVATYTSAALTTTTYFRCYISCSNSSSADTSAVTTITVSSSPLPVLTIAPNGGATYCNGGTPAILSVSGATTYVWSPSAGLDVSTGDLVFATPTAPTNYTVTGSDASGCEATATVNVNVANGPIINPTSSTDTACTGSTVTLNAGGGGGGGGNTYTWNPGAVTGNNVQVNPTATTTYTLTATSGFSGCSTIDTSLVIVITQDVTANFSYTMNGNTVLFHDSSFNASSWSWSFGDGNGSTNQNPIYTFSGTGAYIVTLIVTSAGCPGGDTIQIQLSVFPNRIKEIINSNQLLIYPNPVTDNLLHINFVLKGGTGALSVVNSLGQVVATRNFIANNNKQMNETINLLEFASGIYEIILTDGDSHSSVRFVKH